MRRLVRRKCPDFARRIHRHEQTDTLGMQPEDHRSLASRQRSNRPMSYENDKPPVPSMRPPLTEEIVRDHTHAVESLFNPIWLNGAGPHRLRTLWKRSDKLAKIELASLGFFIKQLSPAHRKWLTDNARDIRNQPTGGHGLIFEMIALGSLAARGMPIKPMPKRFPGYDAEVTTPDGRTLRVSVKNHDLSDHEAAFRRGSARLAHLFRRRVLAAGGSWQASVRSATHIGADTWEQIAATFRVEKVRGGQLAPGQLRAKGISVELMQIHKPSLLDESYVFHASCPQHESEQSRYKHKIDQAILNLNKHSPRGNGHSNLVFMRVHASADIPALANYAQQRLAVVGCAVDAIFFYQAAVGYQGDDWTITYSTANALSTHYRGPPLVFPLQFFSGRQVKQTAGHKLYATYGDTREEIVDLSGQYCFMRGHLYWSGAEGGEFTFPVVGPGIQQTLAYKVAGKTLLTKIARPDDEELFLL
eukprot:TRINITY_DN503_c0_g2_i3.p1 TRINITY_DN503_c0_g2~~TRINITY_DN503_c0_g2_i3.p1  ORF type:complete len:474 (-),score=22.35 TRINITY_DN503_c0_g2_i3:1209-2630(-)